MAITYEDLRICYSLSREAADMKWRMDRLRDMAEHSTSAPIGSVSGVGGYYADRIGDTATKLADMQAIADKSIDAFLNHAIYVSQAIDELPDAKHRTVLRQRYIDGLLWEQISEKTHYSISWLKKLHKWGLEALLSEK